MMGLTDAYKENAPAMGTKLVTQAASLTAEPFIKNPPSTSESRRHIPTSTFIPKKHRVISLSRSRSQFEDTEERFGNGNPDGPVDAIGLGAMKDPSMERDEEEKLSQHTMPGGLHPLSEHVINKEEQLALHKKFGDKDFKLTIMVDKIPHIIECSQLSGGG
jgi:hypothetical protein